VRRGIVADQYGGEPGYDALLRETGDTPSRLAPHRRRHGLPVDDLSHEEDPGGSLEPVPFYRSAPGRGKAETRARLLW